jgi:hypothetical protein
MALSVDQLNAVTEKFFVKKLFDNIFDSNPYARRIMKSGSYKSVGGGTKVLVPLNYATTTAAGWYSGADTLSTTDNDNITGAEYEWKSLYAGVTITEEDELKNSGEAQQLSLLRSKMQIAEKTLKDSLGTGLYSDGTDSKSIVGLRDIVAADQTVGGISQTDNSWWQAQVDSSTATLTMSAMNTVYEDASVDDEKPTVGLCTRAVYNFYYNLLQPQQRFMDEDTAKGGFQSLMFNGVPIISDSHCPASHLFFVNEKHAHLFYHPSRNMKFEPFQKPINQQVKVARILWMGAFGSSNNRLHGKLSAITA